MLNRLAAWSALFCLLSIVPANGQIRTLEDIPYSQPTSSDEPLLLDLYLPQSDQAQSDQAQSAPEPAAGRPAVLFVHGGGWRNGSKKSTQRMASWLAKHDFVVAGIDYRLTDVAGWPAQIDDCYAAVRWLRDHADEYGIDPARIGAWGTSAGGHLVALMGTRNCPDEETTSSRVQAVCDFFGPTDLLTMPPNNVGNGRTAEDVANSNGAKLLRATVREVPELARDASALHQVSADDAPCLIMHGAEDPGVPVEQSRRFHQALTAAGVASQLVVLPAAGHGGAAFRTEEVRQTVLKFFQQALAPADSGQHKPELGSWPQGSGPHGNFNVVGTAPVQWSVVHDRGIAWRKTLPETGQSTVTIAGQQLFFTTMAEVQEDSKLGQNIVAWCCDRETGATLWQREIPAEHPLKLSGCFSDSSAPPAVVQGDRVCFFNASGRISCFDRAGELQWTQPSMAVGRSQPFIVDDCVVYIRQTYMPTAGHFSHEHRDAPRDQWTQLQALELATGRVRWTSECGVGMGSVPLPLMLADGRQVVAVGRGGGHSPPEKPDGVSLLDATDGSTLWTLPLDGFMSTMTLNATAEHLLVFHDHEHLWVELTTGKISRRVSFLQEVSVRRRKQDQPQSGQLQSAQPNQQAAWTTEQETLTGRKKRGLIQQSNVLAGNYHYFRSYNRPYLGRLDVTTGRVEYLQLPAQLKREPETNDALLWSPADLTPEQLVAVRTGGKKKAKAGLPIERWCFALNTVHNSRGHQVMGDGRSQGSGWGHHASQVPIVVGQQLILPVMNGTVYVLQANAPTLDEHALLAINDLGPVGESFNRASISFADGRLYAHTIRELICISGEESPANR